uniref:Uncharacterized immunity region protein 14 n=1 Tax=Bacillus phage phi105 TaxID=10717 RepID=YIME_BPPH1|nr:RecName: Full=Uncharacterized immunity region protein 14 [Bacillus phage phi105]AAA88395.1 unknown protein [Bacillus phage phi105]prf//1112178F ORF 14 [Bacillus phage phi105]
MPNAPATASNVERLGLYLSLSISARYERERLAFSASCTWVNLRSFLMALILCPTVIMITYLLYNT